MPSPTAIAASGPAGRGPRLGAPAAAALVTGGLLLQDLGAALASLVFPEVGPLGMVTVRLVGSALVLLLVARPRLHGHRGRDWATVAGFGLVMGGMNACFYEAIQRLPLGVTVTIETLGPLLLAVVLGRRLVTALWAVLGAAGVVLLGGVNFGRLDPLGLLFAVLAAALWMAYIPASAATGRRFARLDGLAIALGIAGLAALPFGAAQAGGRLLQPWVLGVGLAVALMSSAIPYAAELVALRRIRPAAFGVLMSMSPAVASLAGFLVLRQGLEPLDLLAIGLVITASVGAVLGSPPPPEPSP